jgi:hypothetical protein
MCVTRARNLGAAAQYHEQAAQQDWAYGNPNAAQWEQFKANEDAWFSGL